MSLHRDQVSAELEMFYRLSVDEAVEQLGSLLDDGRPKSRGLVPVLQSRSVELPLECVAGGAGERRGVDVGESPKKTWFGVSVGSSEGRQ